MSRAAKATPRSAYDPFGWIAREPLKALLVVALLATFAYFYGFLDLFIRGTFDRGLCSTFVWAWQAWNPQMNQEHSKLVPLIFLGLLWYHRRDLIAAPKAGSNWGLLPIGIGIGIYILGARCLQPRMALCSVPFLLWGIALFVWGRAAARIVLFPCAFLVFMIPVAALEQATFRLQFIITGIVSALSHLSGISIQAVGTTLSATDGSFNFDIAEGCSGIRSLTAMAMLTAVYVHLKERTLTKKLLVFFFSVVFAIAGNAGRIFTVVLVARWIDPKIAAGIYHDYSGFVFFPIAVLAMLGFSKLVNMEWHHEPAEAKAAPPLETPAQ